MAITISGSGIVEANLADNAVTLAKMASGTDGQIITYDASGNPAAVGPGTDGQVLTSTGSTTPPAFEAAAGGGKVLQVLSTTNTGSFTSSSTSFVDTGLEISITPQAGSKVYVMATIAGGSIRTSGTKTDLWAYCNISRGSTELQAVTVGHASLGPPDVKTGVGMSYLDASHGGDGSTSITYKVRASSRGGAGAASELAFQMNIGSYSIGKSSTITVFEIGA